MSGDASTPAQDPSSAGSDGQQPAVTTNETLETTSVVEEAESAAGAVESESATQSVDNETRLEQLEKEHSALREEHEVLRGQYVRIAADFDNFRKRQSRDQDDLKLQLICSTLSEILPVVDNFERARQQLDPQTEEAQALHRSYQGLYKQLVEVLKQLGVAPMRVVGQEFDPTLHEAVLREPSEEHPEDVVIEELQRGYHLDGRVLRHAMVKVSMGPGPQQDASGETSTPDAEAASDGEASGDDNG